MANNEGEFIEYDEAQLEVGVEYMPQLITITFSKEKDESVLSVAYLSLEQIPSFIIALYDACKELTQEEGAAEEYEWRKSLSLSDWTPCNSGQLGNYRSRN